jgi:hypothetical protein
VIYSRSKEFYHGLLRCLLAKQNARTAGWGYHSEQEATEATCLALLALRNVNSHSDPDDLGSRNRYLRSRRIIDALEQFKRRQNPNGSWSAFDGDDETGCSTTALAVITLIQTTPVSLEHLRSAVSWLVNARGREAHWLWQWRFRTVDKKVKFDPAKYGWSWVPDTTSWVVPTAFAVIALEQARRGGFNTSEDLNQRVELGRAMLFDRMCPSAGWNSGNGVAFGVPVAPHIDATAIALLALRSRWNENAVRNSLLWLVRRASGCPSAYSVAWSLLAMAAYGDLSQEAREHLRSGAERLMRLIGDITPVADNGTLAVSALALEAIQGQCVFEVRT